MRGTPLSRPFLSGKKKKRISGMLSPIYIKKLKSYMCVHVCTYIFILIFGRIHKMRVERTERSR